MVGVCALYNHRALIVGMNEIREISEKIPRQRCKKVALNEEDLI